MRSKNIPLVFIIGFFGVISRDIESWTVEIRPKVQKVAEGSIAIFTCEATLSKDVKIKWTKPTKPIKPKDEVEIVQISPNRSILKVAMASPKRHRRTYRCTAFYEDPSTGVVEERNANAVLKVIGKAKLKDLPKVIARVDTWMTGPPGTIPLVCEIEGLWAKYTQQFTWFKDGVTDLSFEKDNWKLSEGFRILNINIGSGGVFQCVAYYKKGSVAIYSNVLTLEGGVIENTEEPEKCEDYNGTNVAPGEMYYRSPCEYCMCDDKDPSYNCALIDCAPMPVGCMPKVGGKCCEYVCPNGVGVCTDYRGNPVSEGGLYRPGDDPCEECLCTGGSPSRCEVAVCDAPPCRNYITIPDTCCGFRCLDCFAYDGEIIPEGESYQPESDPCKTCVCEEGEPTQCFNVACMKPRMPCEDPLPIPGECCKFTCGALPGLFNETVSLINRTIVFNETTINRQSGCVSYNGTNVNEGEIYSPGSDACEMCTCRNGGPELCLNVACIPPPMPCNDPRPVPGVCCQFTCNRTVEHLTRNKTGCVAYNGNPVREGEMYSPDRDPCKTCTCQNGREEYCMMVACRPPPMSCDNPRPVPGVCCKFTCDENPVDLLALNKTECRSFNGTIVQYGTRYQPSKDPCQICICKPGEQACMYFRCAPPPDSCLNPQRLPNDCCGYTCNMTAEPGHMKKAGYYSIPIRPVIQQIGPRVAMVQWEVPDREKVVDMENVTIHFTSKDYYGHFEAEDGMDHIVVNGLNQSRMYEVSGYAYGKLRNSGDMRTLTQVDPVLFTLDTRATTSLNLRNAVGKVYESRGSYESGPYSLPRPFEEVMVDSGFQVTMNLNTFNMVEISSYVDTPCTKQECGLLRFYMYNMTGYPHNVMSLMFEDDLDFNWAKAHL